MSSFYSDQIHFSRQQKTVLQGISLRLQAGEVISLLGANGAGKSTFLSALAGELKTQGNIYLNDVSLSAMTSAQQARSRSMLPQQSGLSFDLGVNDVIAMGAYPFPELSPDTTHHLSQLALHKAEVSQLAGRRYLELSGGEQQRVHYARALLQLLCGFEVNPHPRYLLLDEPTASLDPLHQHALLHSACQLARHYQLGILMVLHEVNLASQYSDRIALLANGTVFACDTPQQVLTSANLYEVYGIHAHILPHPEHSTKPLVVFSSTLNTTDD